MAGCDDSDIPRTNVRGKVGLPGEQPLASGPCVALMTEVTGAPYAPSEAVVDGGLSTLNAEACADALRALDTVEPSERVAAATTGFRWVLEQSELTEADSVDAIMKGLIESGRRNRVEPAPVR